MRIPDEYLSSVVFLVLPEASGERLPSGQPAVGLRGTAQGACYTARVVSSTPGEPGYLTEYRMAAYDYRRFGRYADTHLGADEKVP